MKALFATIFISIIFLKATTVERDHYRADFKRIQAAYKSYPSLSFTVAYTDHHSLAPVIADTLITAHYYFKGTKFYYKMDQVEFIKNNEYVISINHKKKDMVIYNAAEFKGEYMPIGLADSILDKSNISFQYREISKGKKGCYIMDMQNPNNLFNKMEMQFDKSSYLVDKIRLYISPDKVAGLYNNIPPKSQTHSASCIDYIFSNYRFSNIDEKLFNTKSYMTVSEGHFKVSNQYAGYHIVSLIPDQHQSK